MSKNKIALVHDFLTSYTGAERVLKVLADMFPEAPIYTLLYDKSLNDIFPKERVITSNIQNYPAFIRTRRKFLVTSFPRAIEQFDFSDYDLVISSSGAFSKGILTKPGTKHLCYCHAAMRYVWDWHHEYLAEHNLTGAKKFFAEILLHNVRMWDTISAERVDHFLANSKTTQQRIKKYYQRYSDVVFPPVDTERFSKITHKKGDYFFIVSRLEPYKRIDIPVRVFNRYPDLKLVIAGKGSASDSLKALATSPNITFKGFQSDDEITRLYAESRAFIFPGDDDFGITPIEAMSCGKPIIAINKGGVKETVIDKKTGVFFDEQTDNSFEQGLLEFFKLESTFDSATIIKHAKTFNKQAFIDTIHSAISTLVDDKEISR